MKEIKEFSEQAKQRKEEERKKYLEDDINYVNEYNKEMERLKEEEKKEKEAKRLKEKDLAEYHKLQYEEKRKQVMEEFIKINQDAYNNLKRLDNENDDFIKYAEHHIQEYQKQGKNVHPLLIELKKYKQKYAIQ
jgi:hypothetical protein